MFKILFYLLIFCAGFATAIYTTTPAQLQSNAELDSQNNSKNQQVPPEPIISPQMAQTINNGMHLCVTYSKQAAVSIGKIIKEKLNDTQTDQSGEG